MPMPEELAKTIRLTLPSDVLEKLIYLALVFEVPVNDMINKCVW